MTETSFDAVKLYYENNILRFIGQNEILCMIPRVNVSSFQLCKSSFIVFLNNGSKITIRYNKYTKDLAEPMTEFIIEWKNQFHSVAQSLLHNS
jgi:hypothetical protein